MAKVIVNLVYCGEVLAPMAVDARLWAALGVQRTREVRRCQQEKFEAALARAVSDALHHVLDEDLHLPHPNQIAYMAEIARELDVPIPSTALNFRGASSKFIGRFTYRYRASRDAVGAEKLPTTTGI